MSSDTLTNKRTVAVAANRLVWWFSRHWLLVFNLTYGLFVGLPWLAPLFMQLGWTRAATAVYLFYSTQCHQLPQRSFFLFGEKLMYSLGEIQAAWQNTSNPIILRQFIGNADMGWKVAWSDRMVSMYTSIPILALGYGAVRRWLSQRFVGRPLPLWAFALLLLPMAVDGGTHLMSDLAGIGNGFRDSNAWLAALTNNALPATFYAGDALGSFNSWMRLITGLLFGLGLVWLVYPRLDRSFVETAGEIEAKLRRVPPEDENAERG
ncbi:MAG: DUF2085 domain-containing protein [Chloroflexi bacterium]|nr:DUF2085 domain-containing protein [Chloroflexota bacterium]MCI0577270.1 DUF2085 domain-containing protein [Chloroflexota bacterium]MCI0649504.1 DUF2085 domain-containing protein [Chloroflexota bacterium]